MYGHSAPPSTAVGVAGVLPYTGLGLIWIAVIALTILSVGFALLRVIPRREV
jgi:hypothetical protein